MPKLGLTMQSGKVMNWLKREGETVTPGEPLLEIESEKVSFTVEAPAGGILRRILIGNSEDVDAYHQAQQASAAEAIAVSPAARKRAKDLGIDPAQVPPRAGARRLTTEDVEAFHQARQASAGPGQAVSFFSDGIKLDARF